MSSFPIPPEYGRVRLSKKKMNLETEREEYEEIPLQTCSDEKRLRLFEYQTERGRRNIESFVSFCPVDEHELFIEGDPYIPKNFAGLQIDFVHCIEYESASFCATE